MRFTIDIDDSLLDALRAIDPAVIVEDGDDPMGDWRVAGAFVLHDAELQEICTISKAYWKEKAPLVARVIASFLDQAAMSDALFPDLGRR